MPTNITPNMGLPTPVVGAEPGPQWGTDNNNCFNLIDVHNHSAGAGVQVTPAGLNINTFLTFNNNDARSLRTSRYISNPVIGPTDLQATYVAGVDLYYVDGNGNQIRITQGGAVSGAAGTITGLPSGTASASYQAGIQTFVFQSATVTPANLDGGALVLRNILANSHGLTLTPPAAMGADYAITLPTLPASTQFLRMTNTGAMAADVTVDNTTLTIAANLIQVAPVNFQVSASSGAYSTVSTVSTPVTNLSVTLTTNGRPVVISCIPDGTASVSYFGVTGAAPVLATYEIRRNGAVIATGQLENQGSAGLITVPVSTVATFDPVAAGIYTYTVNVYTSNAAKPLSFVFAKLYAYELA